jgi:hypothetical protein
MTRGYSTIALCAGFATVLHGAWEWIQCGSFFIHLRGEPDARAMILATLGDLLLTGLGFAVVAVSVRDRNWITKPWPARVWIALEISAVVLSLTVEAAALHGHFWTYTSSAPLIPGTSFSALPLLQLMLLFPITFALVRWAARRK